jgi:hypothetical protein
LLKHVASRKGSGAEILAVHGRVEGL